MLLSERITMQDSCRLATDIYLPGDGKYPVLLMMTPYGKRGMGVLAQPICAAGYALVVQDVRGRYDSDGAFNPIAQERTDGPETVAWITAQPWYDSGAGIGIIGLSYLSEVGLALAARCPEVRAMINIGGMAEFYDVGHRGGALTIHHFLPWTIITSRSPQPSLHGPNWSQVYATWPTAEAAGAAGLPNELWSKLSVHPSRDRVWDDLSVRDDLPQVDIPILHFSGWYDVCLGATLNLYRHFTGHASSPQQLVLGPWSHNGVVSGARQLAGVDFGKDSQSRALPRMLAWFDRYLKLDNSAPIDRSPVNVFITGEQRWLLAGEWPPVASTVTNLYLGAGGGLEDQPGTLGQSSIVFDPADPAPTCGGSVWEFPQAGLEPGPTDQAGLLERSDTLCFTTAVIREPLTLVGPAECRLYAEVDTETADFVVRLVDVHPNGEARWVADGIVRGHYRQGDGQVVPVQPGKVEEYRIDLWAVGHAFLPGHRLALIITGSSFPKWDINRGSLQGDAQKRRQTVHFGAGAPSALSAHVMTMGATDRG